MPLSRTVLFASPLVLAAGLAVMYALLRPKAVEVVAVEQKVIRPTLVASCQIRNPNTAALASESNGLVSAVAVEPGARVATGETLVSLTSTARQAEVGIAEADLRVAEAELRRLTDVDAPRADLAAEDAQRRRDAAQADYDRINALMRRGAAAAVSLRDAYLALEQAEHDLAVATAERAALAEGGSERAVQEAKVEGARASLRSAEVQLDQTRLAAPFDGLILSRQVEPGEWVTVGTPLVTLQPTGETRVSCAFDERNLTYLQVGQGASAAADAFPKRKFRAVVRSIGAAVDPDRGSVDVDLTVEDPPEVLRQGMTVSVEVETGPAAPILVVPASAVVRDGPGEPYAMVLDDGRARKRALELGVADGEIVEVEGGLAEGEQVLRNPAAVRDGQAVRVVR